MARVSGRWPGQLRRYALILYELVVKTVFYLGIILCLSCCSPQMVYAQGQTLIVQRALDAEPAVEKAVENALGLNETDWKLTDHHKANATSFWTWKHGRGEISFTVSYLVSSEDAQREIKLTLTSIALPSPRFQAVNGLGDEAYVVTEGDIIFRTKNVAVQLRGYKVKTTVLKRFAERIANAVSAA